jgi:hypothetical protein
LQEGDELLPGDLRRLRFPFLLTLPGVIICLRENKKNNCFYSTNKMATGERKAGKGMQFLFGGLSGMLATCVVQPLDLVKTRYVALRWAIYSFPLVIDRTDP